VAKSGIYWIDVTFDWCVIALLYVADILGITYEEINVWLFCIILPIVLLTSLYLNIRQFSTLRAIRKFHNGKNTCMDT
jgi:hypothetical protein